MHLSSFADRSRGSGKEEANLYLALGVGAVVPIPRTSSSSNVGGWIKLRVKAVVRLSVVVEACTLDEIRAWAVELGPLAVEGIETCSFPEAWVTEVQLWSPSAQ